MNILIAINITQFTYKIGVKIPPKTCYRQMEMDEIMKINLKSHL